MVVHLRATGFDITREPKNLINPIPGYSLLRWLRQAMVGHCDLAEPEAEDWGWYICFEFEGASYLLGACALIEGELRECDHGSQALLEWVVQLEKKRSLLEKLFERNEMTRSDPFACLLLQLLKNRSNIELNEVLLE